MLPQTRPCTVALHTKIADSEETTAQESTHGMLVAMRKVPVLTNFIFQCFEVILQVASCLPLLRIEAVKERCIGFTAE